MRLERYAIAVVSLYGCAALPSSMQAPVVSPVQVDFSDIPAERCSPSLDGLFVSHQGAIELVRGMRRADHDYQVKIIELDAAKSVCQFDLRQTKEELAHTDDDRKWALVGRIGVAGAVVGAIVAGVAIIYQAVKK